MPIRLTMGGLFHHWRHSRRCYLICGIARSGSNLLSDGLRDTGRAGRPNQFFLPSSEPQFRAAHSFDENVGFANYVRGIVENTVTSNEVFGFKLMAWYLDAFLKRLRETGEFGGPGASDLEMLTAAFPGLRFLRITRRDKLRQAISKARAVQTGLWKVQEGKSEVAEPEYDRALIAQSMLESKAEEDTWNAFFLRLGERPFQVEYERLCEDFEGTVSAVLDFLEIRLPRRIKIRPPVTTRQSDALSDEWVRRYRAEEGLR
ncbi:MAG: Stf0 family sulfotransferase [Chthoniobacterales bacterium]